MKLDVEVACDEQTHGFNLLFDRELIRIIFDEASDLLDHVEQSLPLTTVQGHREPPQAVET